MIYRIFHPIPILADVVEHYWYAKVTLEQSAIQHYPTPLMQGLAFNFRKQSEEHSYSGQTLTLHKEAYLFGQPTCPRIITTNESGIDILGVKFRPLGITKITGINMEYMADQIIPAEDIWGNELELLCDQMQSASSLEQTISVLEKFLVKKYLNTSLHYRVENAQNALTLITSTNGTLDVKTLQSKTNTSRKTLERTFEHYLGISPKLYSRIVRFNAVKEVLDSKLVIPNLTAVAHDFGFYDSSHFAADFKRFSGITPSAYLKSGL